MSAHASRRRAGNNNPEALTVGAIYCIIGRTMPAPTGTGRHAKVGE